MPQKKKQSKLSRAIGWLKPNTLSKKLILFMVVIAAVGGGYSVYRSKAASWTVGADSLSAYSGAYHSTDCNGNKGCIRVVKLPPHNSENGQASARIYVSAPFQRSVFICVTARAQVTSTAPNPTLTLAESSPDAAVANSSGVWTLPKDTIYREYCIAETLKAGSYFSVPVINNRLNGSEIYVANITMKW